MRGAHGIPLPFYPVIGGHEEESESGETTLDHDFLDHRRFPLVDEEIPKVHRFVRAEMPNVRIVGPTLEFSELTMDKWEMARALDAANVDPATDVARPLDIGAIALAMTLGVALALAGVLDLPGAPVPHWRHATIRRGR